MEKTIRRAGIICCALGVLCNQWVLSFVFPHDGFHAANILEKSLGEWGFASKVVIWFVELLFLAIGVVCVRFARTPKKLFFICLTSIMGVSLTALGAEGIVRLVSPPNVFSPFIPLRPHNVLELHVNLRGVADFARNTTNRWGLRGDEPPADWDSECTIITIGGSTTQCFYLDDTKTWPYLLQEKLKKVHPKTWVGNAGISGHSSRAHILFVRDILPQIKPKMAILLTGINDLWYSLDDHALTQGNPSEEAHWKTLLLGYSRLAQLLFLWKIIWFDHPVVLDRSANENFASAPLQKEMELPADVRTLVPSIGQYRQNLLTIIHGLREQNIRTIFLTQPLLYDDSPRWKNILGWEYSNMGRHGFLSAATHARLLGFFNDELRRVCNEERVEVVDLAATVPHSEEYFYDSMHFTERGAEVVAEQVTNYIESRRPQGASSDLCALSVNAKEHPH
jgi:lysophospholipase L1-like esterase